MVGQQAVPATAGWCASTVPPAGPGPVSAERLLGREVAPVYGAEAAARIRGASVLVTGAGGSIGSEIVRQLRRLGVGEVWFVDNDEYALYRLQRDLTGSALLDDEHFVLADVANRARMAALFAAVRPRIVFHAAAHKHLPLLERSPESAILTNVLGTEVIADACRDNGVDRLITISTDKAANPTSVLGASKRLAEMVTADRATPLTRTASVRFGNVLGSRGSFYETLVHQVAAGQPVRITDPRATRYFMTIPEAAGLVIETSVLAESGRTYLLDMGEPVRILDLIRRYSDLAGGARPEIVVTGLRPGEKLHEELVDFVETCTATRHPRISGVDIEPAGARFAENLQSLYSSALAGAESQQLREGLFKTLESLNPRIGA